MTCKPCRRPSFWSRACAASASWCSAVSSLAASTPLSPCRWSTSPCNLLNSAAPSAVPDVSAESAWPAPAAGIWSGWEWPAALLVLAEPALPV